MHLFCLFVRLVLRARGLNARIVIAMLAFMKYGTKTHDHHFLIHLIIYLLSRSAFTFCGFEYL